MVQHSGSLRLRLYTYTNFDLKVKRYYILGTSLYHRASNSELQEARTGFKPASRIRNAYLAVPRMNVNVRLLTQH